MANIRDTSRAAFEHLVATGQLIAKQAQIVGMLLDMPGATSGEVLGKLNVSNVNAWRARFTELQARGLIRETGARRCKVSNRTCITWVATDRRKPLDDKRGARALSADAKAWRKVADQLYQAVEAGINKSHPEMSAPIDAYRKLAGVAR